MIKNKKGMSAWVWVLIIIVVLVIVGIGIFIWLNGLSDGPFPLGNDMPQPPALPSG
jgi:flagellar basal body-associated protein FliL